MMTSKELKEHKNKYLSLFENEKEVIISMQIDTLIKLIENQEKLTKVIDILKEKLWLYEERYYRLSVDCSHDCVTLTQEEYKLLKEVLGNE